MSHTHQRTHQLFAGDYYRGAGVLRDALACPRYIISVDAPHGTSSLLAIRVATLAHRQFHFRWSCEEWMFTRKTKHH